MNWTHEIRRCKHNPKSMVHHDYTLLFKGLGSVTFKIIQKLCIKLIQSDSKDIYIGFCFKWMILKDDVTLKTGVTDAENSALIFLFTVINYILKYTQIYFKGHLKLKKNISYYCFTVILNQINAAMVSINDFFQKTQMFKQQCV